MILTDERIDQITERALRAYSVPHRGSHLPSLNEIVSDAIRQALKEALEWRDIESAPRDGTPALFKQRGNKTASVVRARVNTQRVDYWSEAWHRFHNELPEAPYVGWLPLPPFGPTVDKGEG